MLLREKFIFLTIDQGCVIVRKLNIIFDYKFYNPHELSNYVHKGNDFEFINIVKRK